jgi:putative DNA primase/helicase
VARSRINFKAVSAAARSALDKIVPQLLPGGRRDGNEWVVRNPTRADSKPGSFKVNLQTGVWADFATADTGGDIIDLLAYIKGNSKVEAARELREMLNVKSDRGSSQTGNATSAKATMRPDQARLAPKAFPPRTTPDKDNKPLFIVAGDDGPSVLYNEKRRHVYRQGGIPIRIKIMTKYGDALNVYRVAGAAGETGWQYKKPEHFSAVPYFIEPNPFAAPTDQPIYWPEGEKDVDTLARLGLAAFTFGGTGDGLPSGCEDYVRDRHVVILADNDEPGRKHAESKAALALAAASSVKVIHFPELPEKGDVTDWLEAGHSVDDLLARIASIDPVEPVDPAEDHLRNRAQQKLSLPHGFSLSDRGLLWSDLDDDPDKPAILIAGHFDVVAETRDGDGASWGVLLHWTDHDGRDHRLALPRATLAGDGSEARRILLDGGFFIAPSQRARGLFNSFLLQVRSPNRARATQRVGWHGSSFVLPDDCFGADARDSLLLQSVTAHEHAFRQAGTLESWQQNVASYAAGNSRLIVAISAAFAGPLIGPCSGEGGGLHFKGGSSTGKTTALHVAGSVWGGGDANGFVRSWRATANGLEGVALGHCDTLLCLDEMSQLAARDAGEAAYMLANGAGKSRSSRDGSARRAAKWQIMLLSSGEIGLADKVAEDGRGRKLAAGQQVRIVDISADAGAGMGMFENLHGFSSPELFARHLRSEARKHYGVAARHYLAAIVPLIEDLSKQVGPIMKAFCEQYVPAGADGQVVRVAQRFALIAVAGELAQQHGVVPWQAGEAIQAAGKCFGDWLSARGGHDAAETRDGIEQVRSFLLANGPARFIPAWEIEAEDERLKAAGFQPRGVAGFQPRDVVGYRQKSTDGWDYFVTTSAWRAEICGGFDPMRLAATLAERGFLEVPASGNRRTKLVRVPGHGQLRLYHVSGRLLESDENA